MGEVGHRKDPSRWVRRIGLGISLALGLGFASLIGFATLDHNPQGEFCDYVDAPGPFSLTINGKPCNLTLDFFAIMISGGLTVFVACSSVALVLSWLTRLGVRRNG